MARYGMKRGASASSSAAQTPTLTHNKAGGEAYNIADPSQRLLTMLGASFWNEPQYYGDAAEAADAAARAKGLSDEAALVLATAREIAASENPRDLLALALWARTEMNVRSTPSVLLAVAAHEAGTRQYVRQYVPRVVQRADELRQVFAAYVTLYAGGVASGRTNQKLPNSLKRGLADAFGRFTEAQLMKYDSALRPTFRDVLRMVDRGKDYGLPQGVYRYLLTGEVTDPEATPVLAARKALAQKKTLDEEALALVRYSHANWEVVLSQFGSHKSVWESVLPQLGYMALLRNLRNLLTAGVDAGLLAERLADEREVRRSRQLPFRFYSAYKALTAAGLVPDAVKSALERALEHSLANLARLPGVTAIASDNSGSMSSPVSAQSTISRQEVSNLMAALAHRLSDEAHVLVFGETARLVDFAPGEGLFAMMQRQACTNVGHSTNAHRVVEELLHHKVKVDRLVLFSDMQCYVDAPGSSVTLAGALARYRKECNPDLVVHSVDLAGYGLSAVAPRDPRTNLLSGFSERVLSQVADFERSLSSLPASPADPEEPALRVVPTLDDLRARY